MNKTTQLARIGITLALLLAPLAALHASEKHATWIAPEDHAAQHGLRAANVAMSPAVEGAYRGWKTIRLRNGLVELQVLPDIGGRIIQFKLGSKEFLWVNPRLAGKLPKPNGLAADGGWFNVGGDKLWPAPQGWDSDRQWPGPPDAVLDGQPYRLERASRQTGSRCRSTDQPQGRAERHRVLARGSPLRRHRRM